MIFFIIVDLASHSHLYSLQAEIIDRFINEKIIVPDMVILLVMLSQTQRYDVLLTFGSASFFFLANVQICLYFIKRVSHCCWNGLEWNLFCHLNLSWSMNPLPPDSKTINCTPSNWKPLQGEGIEVYCWEGDEWVGSLSVIEREGEGGSKDA
jgi:hypothetical protein